MDSDDPITRLLRAAQSGDGQSAEELLPVVYAELQALARARLAQERAGQTLQATALVHEAWLRVAAGTPQGAEWNGRGHFFGAAAQAMRRILVERARRKARLRHGGAHERVDVDQAELVFDAPAEAGGDVLAVDEALARLERSDPRKARIANLRYFAGLSVEETAGALGVSVGTVEREWRFTRSWLRVELGGG